MRQSILNDIEVILNTFFNMMKNDEVCDKDTNILNDATVLHIAYNMPARIKCVTLSWHTLKVIMERNKNESKI